MKYGSPSIIIHYYFCSSSIAGIFWNKGKLKKKKNQKNPNNKKPTQQPTNKTWMNSYQLVATILVGLCMYFYITTFIKL